MTQQVYDEFVAHVREELKRCGFSNIPLGSSMEQYLIDVYTTVGGDRKQMLNINKMADLLIKRRPLTQVTEEDFALKDYIDFSVDGPKEYQMLRCTRYNALLKDTAGDYYDDEAITFVDKQGNNIFIYQGDTSSRKKVELPYLPVETFVKLED